MTPRRYRGINRTLWIFVHFYFSVFLGFRGSLLGDGQESESSSGVKVGLSIRIQSSSLIDKKCLPSLVIRLLCPWSATQRHHSILDPSLLPRGPRQTASTKLSLPLDPPSCASQQKTHSSLTTPNSTLPSHQCPCARAPPNLDTTPPPRNQILPTTNNPPRHRHGGPPNPPPP